MTLTYFQSPSITLSTNVIADGDNLVKRAIIAIEGEHICNQGRKYNMPANFIQTLGTNLNKEVGLGRITPFFRDHKKSAESQFGDMDGFCECRKVTEEDLPNPHARDMLGKMALFANVRIKKFADLVREGTIKALSPGIDMSRMLITEVSGVPIASMPGVALFGYKADGTLVKFGYAEIKAAGEKYKPMRDDAIECLDNLIETYRMLDLQSEQMAGADINQRAEEFELLVADLREIFEIPTPEEQQSQIDGISYSSNPYDRQVIQQAGFSIEDPSPETALTPSEKKSVVEEAARILTAARAPLPSGRVKNKATRVRASLGG
jgi:hypothetical protein